MERTAKQENDYVTPDRIKVKAWGYDINLLKAKCVTFSFDGETIYPSNTRIHNTIHDKLKTHDLLDFRYYYKENLLSVWIYDGNLIIPQLKLFERVYRRNDEWKPFDIDTVRLVFVSGDDIVKCTFGELDNALMDRNDRMRAYHVTPPSLKHLVIDKDWKDAYSREGDKAWNDRHGDIDPAHRHLLMYEE